MYIWNRSFIAALAVYTRSLTAYEALKGFGILQLPSIASLKSFTSFNVESAGVSEECVAFSRKQYDAMGEERWNASQPIPLNEGVLVFDKVKVGLKVHYHAKSGKLLGLPMSADVLASLHDVYETLQSEHRTAKTSYVLQFLWRCTTSNFDVISPYFTSAAAMSAKFIVAFSHWNSALYASLWI